VGGWEWKAEGRGKLKGGRGKRFGPVGVEKVGKGRGVRGRKEGQRREGGVVKD